MAAGCPFKQHKRLKCNFHCCCVLCQRRVAASRQHAKTCWPNAATRRLSFKPPIVRTPLFLPLSLLSFLLLLFFVCHYICSCQKAFRSQHLYALRSAGCPAKIFSLFVSRFFHPVFRTPSSALYSAGIAARWVTAGQQVKIVFYLFLCFLLDLFCIENIRKGWMSALEWSLLRRRVQSTAQVQVQRRQANCLFPETHFFFVFFFFCLVFATYCIRKVKLVKAHATTFTHTYVRFVLFACSLLQAACSFYAAVVMLHSEIELKINWLWNCKCSAFARPTLSAFFFY